MLPALSRALAFARTLSKEPVVLHIATTEAHSDKLKQKLEKYAPDVKFIMVDSPYRAFVRPLLRYVDTLHRQKPDAFVTIVVPEFIPAHWWEGFLHNGTANRLRQAFEFQPFELLGESRRGRKEQ